MKRAGRRRGRVVNGWVILDKPAGITSTRAVARLRSLFQAAKAGHAGTLDPLATGVLPIALGEATKTVPHVVEGAKTYRFTVRWGEGRSTDDADGAVIETSSVRPDADAIREKLPQFTGEVMQTPPVFSAVKISGKRAYDMARECGDVPLAARLVRIDSLALESCPDADHARFSMQCGKGSYVRATVRDLAHALGSCGHVTALRRTRVGPFCIDHAVSLTQLETLDDQGLQGCLMPVARGLASLPELTINAAQADRLKRGQAVPLVRAPVTPNGEPIADGALWTQFAGKPVALAELRHGGVHPVRVFND